MPKKESGIYGMNGKPMMKGKMPPKGMHKMPGQKMPMKDSEMQVMMNEGKKKKKGKKK